MSKIAVLTSGGVDSSVALARMIGPDEQPVLAAAEPGMAATPPEDGLEFTTTGFAETEAAGQSARDSVPPPPAKPSTNASPRDAGTWGGVLGDAGPAGTAWTASRSAKPSGRIIAARLLC